MKIKHIIALLAKIHAKLSGRYTWYRNYYDMDKRINPLVKLEHDTVNASTNIPKWQQLMEHGYGMHPDDVLGTLEQYIRKTIYLRESETPSVISLFTFGWGYARAG